MGSTNPSREFDRATGDYQKSVAAYVHAANGLDMVGLPLPLADPPYLTPPWTDHQISAAREIYKTLGALVRQRKAFEACKIAAYGSSDRWSPRRPGARRDPQRDPAPSPGRVPVSSELAVPPAAVDLIAGLHGPAQAYELALVDYLAAAQRRQLAGAPLGVCMPSHLTPIWTDEQIRATVAYRDALRDLGLRRRQFEEAQAPIIAAVREVAAENAAAARRVRYQAEAAADQPY